MYNQNQNNSDFQDLKSMIQDIASKFETEGKKRAIAQTYLSVDESCEFLRVSRKTLYNYRKQKMLHGHKIVRRVLFKLSDLEFFVESRKL